MIGSEWVVRYSDPQRHILILIAAIALDRGDVRESRYYIARAMREARAHRATHEMPFLQGCMNATMEAP